ncbi:hypothetical protein JOM56_015042 [Amanita muscaria]
MDREMLQRIILPSDDDERMRVSLLFLWGSFNVILKQGPQRSKCLADLDTFLVNVQRKGEKEFFGLLRNIATNNSWEELLENDVFLKQVVEKVQLSDTAKYAWESEFKGDAADVLLTTVSDYLNNERKGVYARHASTINSSGTGKSRMVDQIGMEIITVPMCLRQDGSKGFPPPDRGLCAWLCSIDTSDKALVEKALYALIYALLTVLYEYLINIEKSILQPTEEGGGGVIKRQKNLALAFRTHMSEGQSFENSSPNRESFYNEVIDRANKFIQSAEAHAPDLKSPRLFPPEIQAVSKAGQDLCNFIDPDDLLDSDNGPRRPLVILAFDDSDTLTGIPKDLGWTLFSELRHPLQALVDLPIFSLFLSTAGKFHLLSPERLADPSERIANLGLKPLDPITGISFDDLAIPVEENDVTLDRVVQLDWMSHLGRPLFGAYYDSIGLGDGTKLLSFVKQKLLNGPSTLDVDNAPGILACLSVRFALEFNADWISSRVARTQVERHMRLCVAATPGLERLITLAGSEPLLAEAAYELMHPSIGNQANPVKYLAAHSDLNCVDRGQRGELVAALVIMQARDAALSKAKWVFVSQFMEALLPVPAYEQLSKSMPTLWREGEDRSFDEMFKYHSIWFNHIIRIEDTEMINVDSLWRFITRGAMVVCARNQDGVDIVLPVVCNITEPLSRDNVTAILIQVKNDKTFGLNITKRLLDGLDPFYVRLFTKGQSPRPVIRVVFALASDKDGVNFPQRRSDSRHHPDNFTAFDVWCAGLSSNTFKQIDDQDLDAYRVLLERSLQPHDAFNFKETDDLYLHHNTKVARGRRRRRLAVLTMST